MPEYIYAAYIWSPLIRPLAPFSTAHARGRAGFCQSVAVLAGRTVLFTSAGR